MRRLVCSALASLALLAAVAGCQGQNKSALDARKPGEGGPATQGAPAPGGGPTTGTVTPKPQAAP